MSDGLLLYKKKVMRERLLKFTLQALLLVLFLVFWELGVAKGYLSGFIFSSPSKIAQLIVKMTKSGELFWHIWVTTYETVLGFTLGTLLGVLIAVILWLLPFLSQVLDPYLVVLNSIPKVALGPIFIVWLGSGTTAIISMALAISVIVTVMMVHTAFKETDADKIKLMQSFGAKRNQILKKVVLPSSLPAIVGALKVNVGLSLVGIIVGEFLVSQAGLGFLIVYGGQVFQLSLVMASIIVLCLLSAIFYVLVALLERFLIQNLR
jgi:NitT/TauT family transport system permease protein